MSNAVYSKCIVKRQDSAAAACGHFITQMSSLNSSSMSTSQYSLLSGMFSVNLSSNIGSSTLLVCLGSFKSIFLFVSFEITDME